MARSLFGQMGDGTPVHAFSLAAGRLSATILDMGGTITAIRVPNRDGHARNVVLGLKDLAAYEASGWWNCLIGRYANRLNNGITVGGGIIPWHRTAMALPCMAGAISHGAGGFGRSRRKATPR